MMPNNNDIILRVKELVAESKLTKSRFAIEVGINTSNFGKKLDGKLGFTDFDIKHITEKTGVRLGWLLTGEGQKFHAPAEMLDNIPGNPKETHDNMVKNAADLFTDQALRVEKFIVMLSDEISEVRTIKEELKKQREENARLQEMLHDAIFALRTAEQRGPARISIAAEDRQ